MKKFGAGGSPGAARYAAKTVGLWLVALCAGPAPALPLGADAVVLVNSASAQYGDFRHYLQPYLDNFGVPYSVLDISTNPPGPSLGEHALIIIGHSELDTNGAYLTASVQQNISLAVSNGSGLLNFDSALSSAGGVPRYAYVQGIFGFAYGGSAAAASVTFPATEPASQMHYVTALHQAGETLALSNSLSVAGLIVPSNVTSLALGGGRPLVAVKKFGLGRAVQWGSYGWMSVAVQGPINGLDDLVWRGIVWAARKPFVMRGMPNLVTMRMDDVEGPLWWAHTANQVGFRPWIGVFIAPMAATDAADLRGLVTNGNATASVHSFAGSSFLYWDHNNLTNWPDTVVSNNLYAGTQWHLTNGIPISKVVIPHYSEIGPNALAGLRSWGVQFLGVKNYPGTARPSPWIIAGPYRLYETPQPGGVYLPVSYADFLSVPGHPEFNGQFFDCVTEIRDAFGPGMYNCGEWCPDTNVAATADRGTRTLKRALDSLVLATLFTHEWYIHATSCCGPGTPITPANWLAILQTITNNLAPYHPVYVTLDYACQYVRATRTSRIAAAIYDPVASQVTVTLNGSADMETQISVFAGQDSAITNLTATVPPFSGTFVLAAARVAPEVTSLSVLPGGNFGLRFSAPSNFTYRIDVSTDLAAWAAVTNVSNPGGTFQFQDLSASNFSRRFYRAAWVP